MNQTILVPILTSSNSTSFLVSELFGFLFEISMWPFHHLMFPTILTLLFGSVLLSIVTFQLWESVETMFFKLLTYLCTVYAWPTWIAEYWKESPQDSLVGDVFQGMMGTLIGYLMIRYWGLRRYLWITRKSTEKIIMTIVIVLLFMNLKFMSVTGTTIYGMYIPWGVLMYVVPAAACIYIMYLIDFYAYTEHYLPKPLTVNVAKMSKYIIYPSENDRKLRQYGMTLEEFHYRLRMLWGYLFLYFIGTLYVSVIGSLFVPIYFALTPVWFFMILFFVLLNEAKINL